MLISVGLLNTLPDEKFAFVSNNIEDEARMAEKASNELYDAALIGKIDLVEGAFKIEEWEFNFDQNKLIIPENHNYMVFAEKIESTEKKIEVVYYTTNTIIDDVVITNEFPSPKVKMEGNTMKIIKPQKVEMNYGKFTQEFPIRQFNGKKIFDDEFRHINQSRLIYLRVPKEIMVTGQVTIVEED